MSIESQNSELREKESEISIVDIFHLVIANWYWFVLSILICAGNNLLPPDKRFA